MEKISSSDIKIGMKVYHTLIQELLTIVDDKRGPAYTGENFKDDEISFTYATMEAANGHLYIP